jgi:Holliday junction DNA helicase RuvB
MKDNILSPNSNSSADMSVDVALRPQKLTDFIGQDELKRNLSVFIKSAVKQNKAMDHVLLFGPPGLGKTTLAKIVANELGVGFKSTSAPMLSKAKDLAAILTNVAAYDVLFIDEIHRLNTAVEEILYPAMEDFQLDIIIGEGAAARSIKIDLPPFTLVGATTRTGLLSNPLRDRFGIPLRLDFYPPEYLAQIIMRASDKLGLPSVSEDAAYTIASRSRGTPRIAGRLLRRARDFAVVDDLTTISTAHANASLDKLEVDNIGLDTMDHRYINCIAHNYGGGPVGVETIAAALSEQRDAIEDMIEPYLLQQGFINRTPRGRTITPKAYEHMKIARPMPLGFE